MDDLKALGGRLAKVVALYTTRKKAAAAAGVSTDQLALYIKGESKAPFVTIRALAAPVGASLDWIATGEGEMVQGEKELNAVRSPIDAQLLRDTILALEELLLERGVDLAPGKKARAIALIYELFLEHGEVDRDRIGEIIHLAA